MATQYAIREDEHETRQIKRARATRRMQDNAFLRSLRPQLRLRVEGVDHPGQ